MVGLELPGRKAFRHVLEQLLQPEAQPPMNQRHGELSCAPGGCVGLAGRGLPSSATVPWSTGGRHQGPYLGSLF